MILLPNIAITSLKFTLFDDLTLIIVTCLNIARIT